MISLKRNSNWSEDNEINIRQIFDKKKMISSELNVIESKNI